jgi:hypothetical protein
LYVPAEGEIVHHGVEEPSEHMLVLEPDLAGEEEEEGGGEQRRQ